MTFVLRSETFPTLDQITATSQIVIVDLTGQAVPVGSGPRVALLAGEFLKGPYTPYRVSTRNGDARRELEGIFGPLSSILSQDGIGGTQDGSGQAFDGNGMLELLNKTFGGLVIQRVNCEATTTDAGATVGEIDVEVTVASADATSGVTNKPITVPGGTRFGDNADPDAATIIAALSQDLVVPVGTTVSGGTVDISGPVFFVKGTTGGISAFNTPIDTALPNVNVATVVSAVDNATALFAQGSAGQPLDVKIESCYLGTTNNPGAIPKTASTDPALSGVTEIWAARNTENIREALATNSSQASQIARGRIACVSADPCTETTQTGVSTFLQNTVEAMSGSESYPTKDRVAICFPYNQVYWPDLARNVLVSPAGWKASLFNTLPEEFESGVADDAGVIQAIQGLEPSFQSFPLTYDDYVALKAAGVSALIHDSASGWQFQDSVLADLRPERAKDNRRRYADLWEDTLAKIASPFKKKPATVDRVASLLGEIDAFGITQTAPTGNTPARCKSYSVADITPDSLIGTGVREFEVDVTMFDDLDSITFVVRVGPTVATSAVTQTP